MEEVKKFRDLVVGKTYIVHSYSEPYNSNYGISYIVRISNAHSDYDNIIKIWSTKLMAEYISTVCPHNKFRFTVNQRDSKKYPVIEGYRRGHKFKELQ